MFETPYSSTVCAMIAAGVGRGGVIVNPLRRIRRPICDTAADHRRRFEPAIHFRTLLLTCAMLGPKDFTLPVGLVGWICAAPKLRGARFSASL
ncbi:hypothetical protein DPM13_09520 [Paracoccus mutanolyticus]|uniref:Uncharacterized protein n=1 Tax=Paracoccus mutanolyticus TaxID=1499308 RepID=A0ABM6WRR9_9RHOB|nr:hypothetical protein DPM13_09520 [Paracoccus mutanolyticus]